MEYKIYQLKNTRDTFYGFMGWDVAERNGFNINDYKEVYHGEGEYTLDKLFEKFNLYHPDDFTGHSLSVSDVVAIKKSCDDCWKWYYCDSFGWEDVTEIVVSRNMNKEWNELLWDILRKHFGHKVEIAIYGDVNNPASITLEDMDTNEVILDAGIDTLCARDDV